jgi:ACS family hexuronate transporter-like MFS transporter
LLEASKTGEVEPRAFSVHLADAAMVEMPVAIDLAPNVPAEEDFGSMRWIVLSLIFLITVVNFIDRQTLSVLAPELEKMLHMTNAAYGRIVAALQFGMMTGEFPMGAIMDRWGARLGMSLAVGWWSAATGAQVLARTGVQFGATRFWMGTGECGNYSGGIKTVTRLFQRKERTLAIGIFNSASVVGSTVAGPLIVFLLLHYGLRTAFFIPALLGLAWIPLWLFFYRKEPKSIHDPANKLTSKQMLGRSESWAVMSCRFFIGPVMQFYWYWMPSYLYSVRHMSLLQMGLAGSLPFAVGGLGGVVGGWAAGALQRRGLSVTRVRKITMYGSGVCCITSLLVPYTKTATMAIVMLAVAIFADNFISANMFAAVTDLFTDQQVGRATGLTGVAGGLSGFLFPLLTGVMIDYFSYTPVFLCLAFMPLLGALGLFTIARRQYNDLDQAHAAMAATA